MGLRAYARCIIRRTVGAFLLTAEAEASCAIEYGGSFGEEGVRGLGAHDEGTPAPDTVGDAAPEQTGDDGNR
jgi:hypothetical protein